MISRKITAWLAMAALANPAFAGSNLPLVTQSGQTRQLPSGTTLAVQPSTIGGASLNVPQGVAPTSPVNGDCWTTASGYFCQINGVTINLTAAQLANPNGTLGLANGGTGATTAANARTNLGLGTAATQNTGTSGTAVPLLDGTNTWSGVQTISRTAANAVMALAGDSGYEKSIIYRTGGSARWSMGANAVAESGSNAGSDFSINRFSDAAAYINSPFSISRATGAMTLNGATTTNGIATVSRNGAATQGALVVTVDAGQYASSSYQTGSVNRWVVGKTNDAESGSNNGSDYAVDRFSDAGSFLSRSLAVSRATGVLTFGGDTTSSSKSYVGAINPSNASSNWIETIRPASTSIGQTIVTSSGGYIGIVTGSRSGDNTCTGGCMGTIGIESIVQNNNVTAGQIQYVYGAYIEAVKESGAGTTHGVEVDVRNKGSLVAVTPSNMFSTGTTPGLWLASGAGSSETNNSAALGIVANGTKWDKGIVFDANGLVTRPDSNMEAISLGVNHAITWRDADGDILGNIYGSGNGSGTTGVNLAFDGAGVANFNKFDATTLLSVKQDRTIFSTPPVLPNYTVSALPSCVSGLKGAMAAATDLTAITYNASPTGGGSLSAPVYCTGVSWTIH